MNDRIRELADRLVAKNPDLFGRFVDELGKDVVADTCAMALLQAEVSLNMASRTLAAAERRRRLELTRKTLESSSPVYALPESKRFYTIGDLVAAGYGSRTTIWREMQRGELPAIKTDSGRVLVPRDLFEDHLKESAARHRASTGGRLE